MEGRGVASSPPPNGAIHRRQLNLLQRVTSLVVKLFPSWDHSARRPKAFRRISAASQARLPRRVLGQMSPAQEVVATHARLYAGGWNRTSDLQLMRLASCHCSTPVALDPTREAPWRCALRRRQPPQHPSCSHLATRVAWGWRPRLTTVSARLLLDRERRIYRGLTLLSTPNFRMSETCIILPTLSYDTFYDKSPVYTVR